jgi:hypothetical protein
VIRSIDDVVVGVEEIEAEIRARMRMSEVVSTFLEIALSKTCLDSDFGLEFASGLESDDHVHG